MGGECNSAFGSIGHLPFHFLYQDISKSDITALMVKASSIEIHRISVESSSIGAHLHGHAPARHLVEGGARVRVVPGGLSELVPFKC